MGAGRTLVNVELYPIVQNMATICELPTTRRELRKLDRRQAIVDAARASFLEHGYAGTSMSGLLKSLGGSKATLWSYFRSKEELFAAVIEDVSAAFRSELEDVLTSTGQLETGLVEFCRSFMRKIASPDALATWRLVMAESGRFPEVGRIFHERAASHTQAALGAFLARHIASGELRAEDPLRMAEMLTSLCVSRHTRLLWGIEPSDPATRDADAVRFVQWFLRTFRPDGRSPVD